MLPVMVSVLEEKDASFFSDPSELSDSYFKFPAHHYVRSYHFCRHHQGKLNESCLICRANFLVSKKVVPPLWRHNFSVHPFRKYVLWSIILVVLIACVGLVTLNALISLTALGAFGCLSVFYWMMRNKIDNTHLLSVHPYFSRTAGFVVAMKPLCETLGLQDEYDLYYDELSSLGLLYMEALHGADPLDTKPVLLSISLLGASLRVFIEQKCMLMLAEPAPLTSQQLRLVAMIVEQPFELLYYSTRMY